MVYFCKNRNFQIEAKKNENFKRVPSKIVIKNPKLPEQHQQKQQILFLPQHVSNSFQKAPPQFISNTLRKSITSQRSSHANTTNTNTNSTTITKYNEFNSTPEQYQQQQQKFIYQINSEMNNEELIHYRNNSIKRIPNYDNYINMNQKLFYHVQLMQNQQLQQQQHLLSHNPDSNDDDMIDWSDSSSNISRPYAKIQYSAKE